MLQTGRCVSMILPALLMAIPACHRPDAKIRPWTPSAHDARERYEAHLSTMVDNAVLSDMSVADIHFIPHTSEISGVGEARLARMAKLLNTYGGTVWYETLLDDKEVIQQRLDHVREYLALAGCDMGRVEVTTGMAGGRGMRGDEAVKKFKQGTAEKKSDSTTAVSPAFQGLASP